MRAIRHQLPVYSPVSARAILHGLARGGRGSAARDGVAAMLAEGYRAERVELLRSGTAALQRAIEIAAREAGSDLVALPAFCCYDVATAAVGAGCRISLYDLDPATLSPEPGSLERALVAGARVVVTAALYGVPFDWESVRSLVEGYGGVLIEDAAQGHGACWRGEPLGSLGELAVLSFGRGKGWTGGGGGALLHRGARSRSAATSIPSARVTEEARTLAATAAQCILGRPGVYGIPVAIPGLGLGETHYREPAPPMGMPATALGLLTSTREMADREAAVRRRTAQRLLEELREVDGIGAITPAAGGEPGYLRLPLRLPPRAATLAERPDVRRLGIARSYPTTLAELPAVRERLHGAERAWPGAERLVRELVTLPTHSRLASDDLEAIVGVLKPIDRPRAPAPATPKRSFHGVP